MPPGGELAALFARRKVADEDRGDNNATEEVIVIDLTRNHNAAVRNGTNNGAAASSRPSWAMPKTSPLHQSTVPTTASTSPLRLLPPRASPSSTSQQKQPAGLSSPRLLATTTTTITTTATPPATAAPSGPAENEELKAKFETRNLEAGIPTPSFLLNARANLKKKSSEKGGAECGGAVKAAAAALSAASSSSGNDIDTARRNSVVTSTADRINNGGGIVGNNCSLENLEGNNKQFESSLSVVSSASSSFGYVKGNSFRKSTVDKNNNISNSSNSVSTNTGGNPISESDTQKKYEKETAAASPISSHARSNSFSSMGSKINNCGSNISGISDVSNNVATKKLERAASSTSSSNNNTVKGGGPVKIIKDSSSNISGISDASADMANRKSDRTTSSSSSHLTARMKGNNFTKKVTDVNSRKIEMVASSLSARSSRSSFPADNSVKVGMGASSLSAKSSRGSFPPVGISKSSNGKNLTSRSSTGSSSDAEMKSSSLASAAKRGNSKSDGGSNLQSASTCSSDSGSAKNNIRSSKSDFDAPADETTAALAGAIAANMMKIKSHNSVDGGGSSGHPQATTTASSVKMNMLAARRHRMVSSKRGTSSAASLLQPSNNSKLSGTETLSKSKASSKLSGAEASPKSKTSPAGVRRGKLLARVRASQATLNGGVVGNKGNKGEKLNRIATTNLETDPAVSLDATKIISPTRDEFEVLFADEENRSPFVHKDSSNDNKNKNDVFKPNPNGGTNPLTNAESNVGSNDSISKEVLHLSTDTCATASTVPTNNGKPNDALHMITDTSATVATLPTNNIKPKGKVSIKSAEQGSAPIKSSGGVNSQQSRLHNASTPKIRGSSTYRRNYEGESGSSNKGGDGSLQQQQQQQLQLQQKPNAGMQSFQQQPIEASQSSSPSDHLHEKQQVTPRRYSQQQHEISQSYPLRQSPSQLSQMSAITTPSCFPQESNVAPTSAQSNMIGHSQQPMLVGGPIQEIYETASTGSSIHPGVGMGGGNAQGVGSGEIGGGQNLNSSAFSPGRDLENRRLREELSAMKKRMEEKDAIISQLMKRIGDLESMNRSTVMQAQQQKLHHPANPKPPFTMEPASNALVTVPSSTSISLHSNMGGGNGGGSVSRHTPVTNSTSDSYAMTSLWDQSQPAFHAANATVTAFQQQRSQSHDNESHSVPSLLPMISGMLAPSPTRSSRTSSLQQQLRIRSSSSVGGGKSSMKMSSNTNSTTSTASVTTANSSKSNSGSKSSSVSKSSGMGGKNRRKTPSSRSISGDKMSRKSPHRPRRGGSVSGSQKSNDDRKFAC